MVIGDVGVSRVWGSREGFEGRGKMRRRVLCSCGCY